MRVVLTHPAPRCAALAASLRQHAHRVLELPLRRLEPRTDDPHTLAQLDALASFDWLVFVSPGAVGAAVPVLAARRPGWPRQGIGLIGPGTEAALRSAGLRPPPGCRWVRPERAPYDAQGLLGQPPFDAPAGLAMLVIRGERGRDDWIAALRERGARVEVAAVLRAEPIAPDPVGLDEAGLWLVQAGDEPVAFVFSTADAIDRLDPLLPREGRAAAMALAVHPRLVARLHELGWSRARLLEPGEAGLRLALESARVAPCRTPSACYRDPANGEA
jgi:uroporphyrinogen-III synthase